MRCSNGSKEGWKESNKRERDRAQPQGKVVLSKLSQTTFVVKPSIQSCPAFPSSYKLFNLSQASEASITAEYL